MTRVNVELLHDLVYGAATIVVHKLPNSKSYGFSEISKDHTRESSAKRIFTGVIKILT